MKRFWKVLVPALLALAMILTAIGALAEGAYGVATLDKVVVFRQPSASANYWFRIDTGHVCEILDVSVDGETTWYKVNTTHPEPNGRTYIGYVRGTAFRPLTAEETEAYLQGQGVITPTATPGPTLEPSTDDALNDQFNPGIMGGGSTTPEDEEDDLTGGAEEETPSDPTQGNTAVINATGEITASGTNFRVSPSVEGELIGKLNEGTVVELLTIPETIDQDHWYRVRYNGQEGYIQSNFIRVLTQGTQTQPQYSYYGYAKLIYDTANLRDAAGGETYAQWEGKGSLLQIVGPSEPAKGYDWYPVYFGVRNKIYYVREDVIEIVNVGGSNTSAPTSTPSPTPAPGVSAYGYVKMVKGGVNLRIQPGDESILQIKKGTIVPCVGPAVDPDDSRYTWYYVEYNGMRGYVRGDCVVVCGADGGTVTVTPTPEVTAAPTVPVSGTYGYIKLIKGGVNLRETAGGSSQGQLPKDLILPVIEPVTPAGTAGRYAWYKVRTADGRTGYIRGDCAKVCNAEGGEVEVTPTPQPGGTVTNAPVVSAYGYVQITEGGTNLRDAVEGETQTQLKKGSIWPMTGLPVTYKQVTWYPIQAGGYTGFVRGDCAYKLSAAQVEIYLQGGEVTIEKPTPAPTVAMSDYLITVVNDVNLRKSASKDSAAPYNVDKGTVIRYTGEKNVGTVTWYAIEYKNQSLYVLGSCVEVMTQAEYEAWLGENPSATTAPSTAKGYVKTIKGGVNIRSAMKNGSVVERVERGTILPYYDGPTASGSYTWYKVKSPKGEIGYIRSEYVEECAADGGEAPVVTPVPGGSTTPSNPQEATYKTLRLGSSGTAVRNLVTELKNQGYYTGDITSSYTTAVQKAVIAFQTAKGLTIDGIAGSQTQHALYGTVPPGMADHNNLSFDFYPVEKIDWYTGGIQQLWAKGANYKVYDVKTGIVWWAHRWSGASHADIETLTAADTARLCKIYGVEKAQDIWDKNLWQRRPCLVTIGTRTFACSLMGMPHNEDGDTIADNNMTGQICMHFTNSKGHDSGKVDTNHQKAIQEAYDWAAERYGTRN